MAMMQSEINRECKRETIVVLFLVFVMDNKKLDSTTMKNFILESLSRLVNQLEIFSASNNTPIGYQLFQMR